MPKYYCDYCDTYLTHDSPSVRKTHCSGRKHKDNVRIYYQNWMEEQAQSLIDATTAAFKAGKIQSNPFQGQPGPGGAMIPPPPSIGQVRSEGGGPGGPHPPIMGMGPGGPMMGGPMGAPIGMGPAGPVPLLGPGGMRPMGPMGPMGSMPGMMAIRMNGPGPRN
ncbi:PREDICTED: U1 small nuclear ribonucleoprotein C-like [Priapulus caudatus]|uniref:U1 small nuclear ribonucleoprotein C n=1 Tax=Priapulus caudatus TaxID=37621 RepID=A0ABM1DS60_PRICU|nr:PREDICTED: U1 small nuclear ribonucleoprotein C-like [Priapulus caudatus]XP_014662781.1 PREDICTED: U1 small nuclear ribonucleoprotein C-like [Priapulus caudatus]